jgi:hypothetical protein
MISAYTNDNGTPIHHTSLVEITERIERGEVQHLTVRENDYGHGILRIQEPYALTWVTFKDFTTLVDFLNDAKPLRGIPVVPFGTGRNPLGICGSLTVDLWDNYCEGEYDA